jgi:hypothetical protein
VPSFFFCRAFDSRPLTPPSRSVRIWDSFGKEVSCYFQAVSGENVIRDNICLNGPRAGFNVRTAERVAIAWHVIARTFLCVLYIYLHTTPRQLQFNDGFLGGSLVSGRLSPSLALVFTSRSSAISTSLLKQPCEAMNSRVVFLPLHRPHPAAGNLIGNMVRETHDHGPVNRSDRPRVRVLCPFSLERYLATVSNIRTPFVLSGSWDRTPYATKHPNGTVVNTQAFNQIFKNLIINGLVPSKYHRVVPIETCIPLSCLSLSLFLPFSLSFLWITSFNAFVHVHALYTCI